MNDENFDKVVEKCIDIIRKSLKSKGKEYAMGGKDRLINFKRGGEMKKTTPEDALYGYWLKHLVSITDIIDKITKENKKIGLNFVYDPHLDIDWKVIEEKIKDNINYLIILKAILKERYNYGKIR